MIYDVHADDENARDAVDAAAPLQRSGLRNLLHQWHAAVAVAPAACLLARPPERANDAADAVFTCRASSVARCAGSTVQS